MRMILCVVATALAVSGCNAPQETPIKDFGTPFVPQRPRVDLSKLPGYVSQKQFGKKWPFTVKEGNLHCYGGTFIWDNGYKTKLDSVTITTSDGSEYALNGDALSQTSKHRWYKIKEICANPDGDFCPGTEPIIKIGLQLAKQQK